MIVFNNKAHGFALGKCAGFMYNPYGDAVISRTNNDGYLMGGVVYKDFNGRSVSLHVASLLPNWVNHDLLWVAFDYPFNHMKVDMLFGLVPSNNTKALEFDLRLGFKEIFRVPDAAPDADLILLQMLREDCRWLKLKPRYLRSNQVGQERSATAS